MPMWTYLMYSVKGGCTGTESSSVPQRTVEDCANLGSERGYESGTDLSTAEALWATAAGLVVSSEKTKHTPLSSAYKFRSTISSLMPILDANNADVSIRRPHLAHRIRTGRIIMYGPQKALCSIKHMGCMYGLTFTDSYLQSKYFCSRRWDIQQHKPQLASLWITQTSAYKPTTHDMVSVACGASNLSVDCRL